MKKIFLISTLIIGATLFNSCTKAQLENVCEAKEQFLSALNSFENSFLATPVSNNKNPRTKKSGNFETIYLSISSEVTPTMISEFENIRTMQDVSNFTHSTGAVMEYAPTENNLQFQLDVDIEGLEIGASSMVSEAKQYLHAIGLKEHEIQEILINQDLPEIALVSLVFMYQSNVVGAPSASSFRNWERRFDNCVGSELAGVFVPQHGGSWIKGIAFIASIHVSLPVTIAHCAWVASVR